MDNIFSSIVKHPKRKVLIALINGGKVNVLHMFTVSGVGRSIIGGGGATYSYIRVLHY